jgi:glucans biosynthesis protein
MRRETDPFANMLRCGAKTRAGTPCRRVGNRRNDRCILHGGRAGAPAGEKNGRWKHGNETKEAKAQRRMIRILLREAGSFLRGGE